MKNLLHATFRKLKYPIMILALTLLTAPAKASHLYGADFFYTHISGNTYSVTLVVYGDCSGGAFPSLSSSAPEVEVYNGSSFYTSTTLVIQSPTAGLDVTPVCASKLDSTTCTNGTIPGVKKFVYTRSITLNAASANWLFRFTGTMGTTAAGRSNSITNIIIPTTGPNAGSVTQLEATLNNISSPNSSPVYTTIPTPFFSINKAASFNPGAVDPNSDSLSYALVPGLEPGGVVTYKPTYSATSPLACATGTFNFSTTTGQLNFTPNLLQKSLVVYRVYEYRNGTLIGTSMREMTFVVLSNGNRPPGGNISNVSGGTIVSGTSVNICKSAGFLSFHLNPSDSDGNTINVAWSGVPAGASFSVTNNNTVSPLGSFTWNVSAVAPGNYTFFVTYTDNGCDLSSKQTQAYTITVLPDPSIVNYTSISAATCTKKARYSITPGIGSPWTLSVYQGSTVIHNFTNITTTQTDSLSPGTYTLRLKNTNDCYKDTLITIAPPPAITPAVTMVQPNCYGDTNGSITLTATGGLTPYKYAIGTGSYSTNNVFTTLYSTNYTLHISDGNDCIKDTTVFLSQPAPVNANVTFNQPPCNFFSSGVITLAGINGIAPYQYALNAGTYGTSGTFSGLYSGTYQLHIRDSKGCIKDSTFILPDSVKVHASAILTNILCNGDATGSVTLNGYGATAPYRYKLVTGSLSNINSFTGLAATTHNFHIEDTNKCYLDTAITLTEPIAIQPNPNATNVLCYGQSNGIVVLNPTGGISPYTYAIGAGTFAGNNTFNNLPVGTYTFNVKDNNNCVKQAVVKIDEPARFLISAVTVVSPACYGLTNGTFTLTATGGNMPYTYSLNTGAFQSSNFFNSLAAGNYSIHFRDANNCVADTLVTMSQPGLLVPLAQLKNSTCAPLNDGIITLSGNGGTPSYTYAVGTGSYVLSPVFPALPAGSYTFHIKDSRGCVKDTIITVNDSFVVNGNANVTDAKCNKDSTGSITILATGGNSPYTYSIASTTYQSSNTFLNRWAGNHNISIKDNLGCMKSFTATVGEPAPIIPNATIADITCFGLTDGQIKFAPSGGTPPYMYAMGNGIYSSPNIITNISVGLYVYHIKDDNGCIKDTILHVQQPAQITMTATGTNVLCFGDTTGRITVNGNGGAKPYTYYVNPSAPQSSNILTGLKAGTHVVFIEDTNHCKASQFVNLGQPAMLLIDKAVITNPTCEGFKDGAVTLTAKGGIPPYLFAMNDNIATIVNEFKALGEGIYSFQVTDSNHCNYDTTIKLEGFPHIVIDNISPEDVKCYGNSDGAIVVNARGGVPPLKYKFSNRPAIDTNRISAVYAGFYKITITDSMNCTLDTSATVSSPGELVIGITATPNDCEGYDNNGMVKADVTGGTAPYRYLWSTNPPRLEAEISALENGKYYVFVTDANQCKDSAIADITYDNCCKVFIPDAFSPNGDGRNDKAQMLFKGDFKLKVFAIYNRFGQKVFSTNVVNGHESEGWDGRVNGVIQDLGTYNYYAVGNCGNASTKEVDFKGTILLVK